MTDAVPFELTILGLAALLSALQLIALSVTANLNVSQTWLAGPRDKPYDMPAVVGRMMRAQTNMFEALAMFAPAALVVALTGASSGFTAACAGAFLVARVVYVPLYALGIPYLRSLVWMVGFIATILMLLAALL
ncbi:MAG: MAPEG family protein [Pseudomonadota bacterium]